MLVIIFALILAAICCGQSLHACSLALHDWKLIFYRKIPTPVSFFPLSELDVAATRLEQAPFAKVFWVGSHNFASAVAPAFLPLFTDKAARLPWAAFDSGPSLMAMARENYCPGEGPLIVGSDNTYIKIALFADQNSSSGCMQLVVQQTGRIRAVHPDMKTPWAQEINGSSWISLIFYQLPVPGRILSFSAYPVQKNRHSIYEDHSYVETLLSQRILKRRPDLVVDPYRFDFPELPE
ncbi:MAG TPA: hypothetical protein PKN29_02820 [Candidatus Ozemobacteraceae bacterium]|nr:hypothetical protein [Candidatus Ozemobacteraceae bacterium]